MIPKILQLNLLIYTKLNLKLYAKKRVNKDNIVSSDIKNSNLFLAVGFNTQFPF